MSVEQNKAVVRRQVEEVWNRGDFSGITEMIAPDYVYHSKIGDLKGEEGFKRVFSTWLTALPDLHAEIEEIVGEGETVVTHLSWSGAFTGKFMEQEPTGNRIRMKEVWIHHFRDGKDAEATPFADLQSLSRQMGVRLPEGPG